MTGPLVHTEALTHGAELNAVYAIARIVAETYDTEVGLDAVFRLARTIFIFDVVSLYLANEESSELEPLYARALGRGRSREAELPWGEEAANEACRTLQTVVRHQDAGPAVKTRDRWRDYLGLPLLASGRCVGSLVFGRFGGPTYPPDHIRLAEFVAWHVGQLLQSRRMARRIAHLEAQRELARMQEEFVSTISHELRTPLGYIKGYVTTLLRDDIEWDEATTLEFLRIIDDEADRLHELIENLLDSSRLESGTLSITPVPTEIGDLIRETISRTQSMHQDMKVDIDIEEGLPLLSVDATRIAQVLDNLLSNAHKYAPGSDVLITAKQENGRLNVAVRDWGPGISHEHLPYLFERFYRAPDNTSGARGTGLGLFICRKIVEAHGGEIGVTSNPGSGSCFFFTLPLDEQQSQEGGR